VATFPTALPTLACRALPSAHVRIQQTGDEAVLLDLASEQYFGLDAVGTRVWQLLAGNPEVQAVFAVLATEYDVAGERLESDLLTLLAQLADAGLITLE
jgi:coenzyme PQQ synthesis protein D (PqqD)